MKLKDLYNQIQKCEDCRLGKLYVNIDDRALNGKVVGYGQKTNIFFVAQNPNFNRHGAREALKACDYGSNKMFAELLKEARLNRDDVFVTNLIKCSTYKNEQSPAEYIDKCEKWIRTEIETLQPRIIVPMGSLARTYFMGKFGKLTEYTFDGQNTFKVFSIFHPAFLSRNRDPKLRNTYINWLKEIKRLGE